MANKRLHLTVDIRGDKDDHGLLDYLGDELVDKVAELTADEEVVIDFAAWIETH